MPLWPRRRAALPDAPTAQERIAQEPGLWEIVPPEGVSLLSSRPSRTGQGGHGLLATYSDGVTASVMVNSDGSVLVLLFRGTESVPATLLGGSPARFTWASPGETMDQPE